MTVAVAERHRGLRQALCGLIDSASDLRLVGHAHDARGLLALLRHHKPRVLLLDAGVLAPRGLQALPLICAAHTDTAILIHGFPEASGHERHVRTLGAAGFLSKAASADTALAAIRRAAAAATGPPDRRSAAAD